MSDKDSSKRSAPYAIVAAFPGYKPKAIGRTYNRADADEMVRFLQRRIPNATFYVMFEPEEPEA